MSKKYIGVVRHHTPRGLLTTRDIRSTIHPPDRRDTLTALRTLRRVTAMRLHQISRVPLLRTLRALEDAERLGLVLGSYSSRGERLFTLTQEGRATGC